MATGIARMKRPPLRALAAFEASARRANFSDAAKELDITTSAVSHQIKSLESFLGAKLFERGSRGVKLTRKGSVYFDAIHQAYLRIDDGTRRLVRRQATETLTVRCGVSFGLRWLVPRLPMFLAENPGLELHIVTPIADSARVEFDCAIRYGCRPLAGHGVEPLPEESISPMCSPSLLKSDDPLNAPSDVLKHRLIESAVTEFGWDEWFAGRGVVPVDVARLSFDNILMTLQAAVAGLGIALEGEFLAGEDLASGRLVVPPGLRDLKVRRPLRSYVVPDRSARDERQKLFRNWLFKNLVSE
jgi:LysR family glycine cleavage system transcriptional activator